TWSVHSLRKTDDGRNAAQMACNHHVIAVTNGLGFQEFGELKHVVLNILVAAKHRKSPHPINNDAHHADDDGDDQDEWQRGHRFSGAGKADHTWLVPGNQSTGDSIWR